MTEQTQKTTADNEKPSVIAWLVLLFVIILIIVGWLYSTKHNFNKIDEKSNIENPDQIDIFKEVQKSFDSFGENMDDIIRDIPVEDVENIINEKPEDKDPQKDNVPEAEIIDTMIENINS